MITIINGIPTLIYKETWEDLDDELYGWSGAERMEKEGREYEQYLLSMEKEIPLYKKIKREIRWFFFKLFN
jgi:hypothetical protein